MEKRIGIAGTTLGKQHLESMPWLDWLRFALATIVTLEHQNVWLPPPVTGGLAVDVFLALSGWLVGGILLRTPRDEMPRFYFNRATRIWIPYLAAVAALYGVAWIKEGIDLNWLKYLFYDLTFTHYSFTVFPQASQELPMDGTGNHFWSLSVEEQFYLLVPLAILLPKIGNRAVMWIVAITAMLLLGGKFTPIAFGVIAAATQFRFGDWHLSPAGRLALAASGVASLATLLYWDSVYVSSILSVAVVLLLSVYGPRAPAGSFFGAVSFPLYLNAWIGGFAANIFLRLVPLPEWLAQITTYAAGLAVAIVFWWCIDRPVMAHRARWYTSGRGVALGVAAYTVVNVGLVGGTLIKWMSSSGYAG